jgi:Flp pilus assembly protein TadD
MTPLHTCLFRASMRPSAVMRRAWWVALLLCCFFLPCGAQNWTEVRSPHFSVITDAGGKRGREVAFHFEQMRAAFGLLIAKDKVNVPVPLQIVALRSTGELKRLAPIYNGKPVRLSGFFAAGEDRSYIGLDLSAENAWETVFHEYAHSLLNGNYPETQPWFDEGFAEYFSTINVNGETVEIGKPPMGDMDLLLHSKWIPVAALFSVRQDSRVYNEGDARGLFYAESWLVVHYLESSQKMHAAGIYFDLVKSQHLPVEKAIVQAFGASPEQMQTDLEKYLRSPQNGYRRYKLPLQVESMTTYREERVPGADMQATLADFALHSSGHDQEAIQELQGIIARQPNNAPAQRSLGYAYLRKGDFAEAGAHFSKAAALDSKDPWVLYYSALLRYREARDAGRLPTFDEALASQRELHGAIALNPQFADAYHLLGLAEIATGNDAAAIQDLLAAISMSPRNELYLANLGYAYLAARKWDAAKTVLTQVKNAADPQVAEMAARNLAQLEQLENHPAYQEIPSRVASDYTAPQWRPKEKPAQPPAAATAATATREHVSSGPVMFFKGTLKSVDCSAAPGATLVVTSGAKTLTLKAADVKHTVVVGADALSCDWHDRRVAVNYRRSAANTGTIVSLEVE